MAFKTPRIETLSPKKLIGKRLTMTYANNRTSELWRSFIPHRKEIKNVLGSDLISMQVYDSSFNFSQFDFHAEFDKWASVEVSDFKTIDEGMESFVLEGGLYAVFEYKGSSVDSSIFEYIFGTWIPNSEYQLDHRPHFEVLGERYKSLDPDSEEEIWIPVKRISI